MGAPDDEVEGEIDGLYAMPLEGFTAARNALASRLKKEGRRELAARVAALAKPSVSAWAVNQLHRRRREELDALLSAGRRAREAQAAALAGAGGEPLREAMRQQREGLDRARREAAELLEAAGHGAGEAVLDRIATTLQALASDPDASAKLEGGRLTRDLDPPGFDALAGLAAGLAASPPARRAAPEPAREPSAAKKRELQAEAAEEAGRQATLERADRARRASQLRKAQADAKKALEQAEAKARSHAAAAREAEVRAERARRAAESAESAAQQAEAAALEARSAASAAGERLAAAKAAFETAAAALEDAQGTE